jgi:hypothetical protein
MGTRQVIRLLGSQTTGLAGVLAGNGKASLDRLYARWLRTERDSKAEQEANGKLHVMLTDAMVLLRCIESNLLVLAEDLLEGYDFEDSGD